jgi:hypothetical protein
MTEQIRKAVDEMVQNPEEYTPSEAKTLFKRVRGLQTLARVDRDADPGSTTKALRCAELAEMVVDIADVLDEMDTQAGEPVWTSYKIELEVTDPAEARAADKLENILTTLRNSNLWQDLLAEAVEDHKKTRWAREWYEKLDAEFSEDWPEMAQDLYWDAHLEIARKIERTIAGCVMGHHLDLYN